MKVKKSYYQTTHRWLLKTKHDNRHKAIVLLGGKCISCGYNKCEEALEFHHTDPNSKEMTQRAFWHRRWEKLEQDLKKGILLCANCHREEEVRLKKEKLLAHNI